MRRWLPVVLGSCLGVGAAAPAAGQWLGNPVRLSAEYGGSVENGPAGWRWGEELRTVSGRFDFLAMARVSPWLATGLDLRRSCGAGETACEGNGWSNVAGVRADILRSERRLNPFLVAGYGLVVGFNGSSRSMALAGGGVRFTTRRGIDPLLEVHWERHHGRDFAMLAMGANGLVRLRGSRS